ncbi:hypothetical protein K466DRAFT_114325 [Polyporus arcularius HHB13444]|uniref:Uncharacterized protein n=1 Tax=Polyporus arcularius HHB13444 TaxID=1314778 RepID=A0A5C3PE94_9APHY|nr:hypothetical protein K466DRAFT_114325 [Polyporus arcularius HHB13444]
MLYVYRGPGVTTCQMGSRSLSQSHTISSTGCHFLLSNRKTGTLHQRLETSVVSADVPHVLLLLPARARDRVRVPRAPAVSHASPRPINRARCTPCIYTPEPRSTDTRARVTGRGAVLALASSCIAVRSVPAAVIDAVGAVDSADVEALARCLEALPFGRL